MHDVHVHMHVSIDRNRGWSQLMHGQTIMLHESTDWPNVYVGSENPTLQRGRKLVKSGGAQNFGHEYKSFINNNS